MMIPEKLKNEIEKVKREIIECYAEYECRGERNCETERDEDDDDYSDALIDAAPNIIYIRMFGNNMTLNDFHIMAEEITNLPQKIIPANYQYKWNYYYTRNIEGIYLDI